MPIPARPMPDCILIQPDLSFGLLKAPFDGPAAADHLDHGCQGGRLRGPHVGRGALGRVAQTPTDQEPPTPVGLQWRSPWEPPPVIPPGACGPVTSLQPTPVFLLQHRQERFDRPPAAGTSDIFFPREGEDIRLGALLPPLPRLSIRTLPTPLPHPAARHV